MKIKIIGRSETTGRPGHVAAELVRFLPASEVVSERSSDVEPEPGVVYVNAAGMADVDACEVNKLLALDRNVREPSIFAAKVEKAGARLVHIGSGCIWTGPYQDNGKPFGPASSPSPRAFYGWTKYMGDVAVRGVAPSTTILRPRMVYSGSGRPRDTLAKLARYDALIEVPQSITSVAVIANTILRVIERERWGETFCVYDAGTPTPHEIGHELFKLGLRASSPRRMSLFDFEELKRPAKRVHVVMRDEAFEDLVRPRHWKLEVELAVRRRPVT